MKKNIICIFLILISLSSFAQSLFDKALGEITSDLAEKLNTKEKKQVVVLYITDINKSTTVAGKYLADVISSDIVNDSRGFSVFDRDNLNEITMAKKLIAEGYIDVDNAKELGKILSVQAIIIGNYTVLSSTIKLSLKALDSNNGFVIAASMKDLPLNSDAGTLLGINVGSNNSINRGFNAQPLNSSEQYNNPETVNKNCINNNTGDYCFYNKTSKNLSVTINGLQKNFHQEISISPGQTQCLYGMPVGSATYYIVEKSNYSGGYSAGSGVVFNGPTVNKYTANGQINIEQCKSKTFIIQ